MFIRKEYLLMGIFLLCFIGAGCFGLTASAGEAGGKKGKVEITWLYPPKYYDGYEFSEGRTWVREEEGGPWSLLDDQGNVLKTGLKASTISPYKDGIAAFLLHPLSYETLMPGFLHRSGDVVLSPDLCGGVLTSYGEGLIVKRGANGLYGFIDLSGKWVILPAYDHVYSFQEGLAAVHKGGKYGFIDKTGAVVIDFKFDDTYSFSNKMARVRTDSTWGVIDLTGHWIVKPLYEKIDGNDRSDLIAVEKDGKVGFIDSKGDVVIDFQYPPRLDMIFDLYFFNKGRAIVILDDSDKENIEYGIIDESGKVLFRRKNCELSLMGDYILYADCSDEGNIECGIIDKSGKVLFRRKNCELSLMGDYVLCENEDGRRSLIDRENREYDLPDNLGFLYLWHSPDEKSPRPFKTQRDGKIGYFTISIKDD